MTPSRAAVILVSLAFALARLLGERSEAFQAFAHIWVAAVGWEAYRNVWFEWQTAAGRYAWLYRNRFASRLFVVLCAVELFAARNLIWAAISRVLETAGVEL